MIRNFGKAVLFGFVGCLYIGLLVVVGSNVGRPPAAHAFYPSCNYAGDGPIRSLVVQADGKVIVGGDFPCGVFDGTTVRRIARFNNDGSLDLGFAKNIGLGPNDGIAALAIQADGKILVGGWGFTSWNNKPAGYLVRLNEDGTRDETFASGIGVGANDAVLSLAILSNGQILVGGVFDKWDSASVGGLVRLDPDGARDLSFSSNIGTGIGGVYPFGINQIVVREDNKIILGGRFTSWQGQPVGRLIQLNADGTRDLAFSANLGAGASGEVWSLVLQPDGKLLVGGGFATWDGVIVYGFLRLDTDGTRDASFLRLKALGGLATNLPWAIWLMPNETILIGLAQVEGDEFGTGGFMVLLNRDGTKSTNCEFCRGPNNNVRRIVGLPDGKLLVGGDFDRWDGQRVDGFVRLNLSGTVDLPSTTTTTTTTATPTTATTSTTTTTSVVVRRPLISINDGDEFTASQQVDVAVVAPSAQPKSLGEAVEVELSNDGGFKETKTFSLTEGEATIRWSLQSNREGTFTKVVYARFNNAEGAVVLTLSDDIFLDRTKPSISGVTLTSRRPDPNAVRVLKAPLRSGLRLVVRGADSVSGLDSIEIRSSTRGVSVAVPFGGKINQPSSKARPMTKVVSVVSKATRLQVRLIDRAGNASAWRSVAIQPSG